ncbi:BON domain-containing protein, partial [Methylobacter sp.]|uniref:BON domain-containing protein n=1 Tax=Methylobacter sp. TaxID=2051955 RepID=UPI0011FA6FBF
FFSALFLAMTLITVTGCASTKTQEATGEYFDDSVITGKINALMVGDPALKAREVNVDTFKGVVQLSGFVNTRIESEKAAALARSVTGVKSVKNDIRIK